MKILLVNPNSSENISENIRRAVEKCEFDDLEIEVKTCSDSPKEIVTSFDELISGGNVVRMLKEEHGFDAAIIGCFADPGLRAAREIIEKPVVGLLESSVFFAKLHGIRYSILASGNHRDISPWVSSMRQMGEMENVASIRYLNSTVEKAAEESDEHILGVVNMCRLDGADAVILGCAGFAGRGKLLSEMADIPVIDGIRESVLIAKTLAMYGKKR